jgi:hypothetical protein
MFGYLSQEVIAVRVSLAVERLELCRIRHNRVA